MAVRGILIAMIAAAWLLLITALLLSAGRLTVRAKLGPRGGFGRLTVEWLLLRYTLYFRANLLCPPYMTLESIKKNGDLKRINKPKHQKKEAEHETPDLPAPQMLDLQFIVGIKDDSALCAKLCGWLRESALIALRARLPKGWAEVLRVGCEPVWKENVFFANAKGMITASAVQIISIAIQMRKRGE